MRNRTAQLNLGFIVLAALAIALLVVSVYGMTLPMAYGASYYHASFYEGVDFNGTMVFYSDNTMVVRNTNFDEELTLLYYYKDGYIFFPVGETQEEHEKEVAFINENFEEAVNAPFYASRINPLRLYSDGPDGHRTVYLCLSSIMMLIPLAAIEVLLIGFAFRSANPRKKQYED